MNTTTKTSIVSEIDRAHLAVGSNGVVFLNVLDLRPEELAFLRARGRRVFQGIEMDGDELAIVRREMNDAGGFNASVAVCEEVATQRRRRAKRRRG
ncbi:MAG: hypothetical protein U0359_19205 [Byssovorax sp.]